MAQSLVMDLCEQFCEHTLTITGPGGKRGSITYRGGSDSRFEHDIVLTIDGVPMLRRHALDALAELLMKVGTIEKKEEHRQCQTH